MTNQSNKLLKGRVMRRIYIEYAKIVLVNNVIYMIPAVFIVAIIYSVSLPNVLQNMPKDSISNTSQFLVKAVANTEIFIKVALALFAFSSLAPLQRIARTTKLYIQKMASSQKSLARV